MCNKKTDEGDKECGGSGSRWRPSLLALVLISYGVLIVLFLVMVCKGGVEATEAYELLSVPFMALIGGTIAIAKDLV